MNEYQYHVVFVRAILLRRWAGRKEEGVGGAGGGRGLRGFYSRTTEELVIDFFSRREE